MDRDELLTRVKRALQDAFGGRLRGVVLYGSEARGKAEPDSDIDLLVLLESQARERRSADRRQAGNRRGVRGAGVAALPGRQRRGDSAVSKVAADFWERSLDSLRVARRILSISPDSAAPAAYYAAFYAVSAHFALGGRTFRKHTALQAAVHRDLVKGEGWPAHLGSAYTLLNELRDVGHYGGTKHVTPEEGRPRHRHGRGDCPDGRERTSARLRRSGRRMRGRPGPPSRRFSLPPRPAGRRRRASTRAAPVRAGTRRCRARRPGRRPSR